MKLGENSIASVQRQNKTIRSCLRLKGNSNTISCILHDKYNMQFDLQTQYFLWDLRTTCIFYFKLCHIVLMREGEWYPDFLRAGSPTIGIQWVRLIFWNAFECLKNKWLAYHGYRESHIPFKEWWINEVASSHPKYYQHSAFCQIYPKKS